MKNGSLRELTSELRDFSRKIKIAPGSTILIGSISHLAGAGVAGYSEELVAVRALIKQEIGQNIHVGPLPLMLPCWTMDSALIRAMVELNFWLKLSDNDDSFPTTAQCAHALAKEALLKSGSGLAAPYSIRLRMPKNLDNPKRFAVESGGWDNLPVCAAPITSEVEKSIIQAIINDLGEKQAMVLSTEICVSRAVQCKTPAPQWPVA